MLDHGRYILDDQGEPIPCEDLLAWGWWMEYGDRILAKDQDESGASPILVSTVFLGLDHSFGGPVPLLWETMIFRKPDHADLYCDRYSTRAEALEGHRKACEIAARIAANDGKLVNE